MSFQEVQLELKKKGLPWSVAKGFDTSTPISEIVSTERIRTTQNLNFSLNVSQQSRQRGNTKDMIFGIDSIIS
ncbi:MAG: fumarylacetoacetate hydrolase family protein [Bacteroidota bacterium]